MDFEWDASKAARNLKKHGVAFEDAARVFLDDGRLEIHDGREDYGEDRWATIGQVHVAILYVVYTVRHEDTIRIISARRALSHEQEQYREANA
ncbi:MAG: BrnT family toxin [Burkholderiales bacterium]|nr:BrnT family toxin [Burkholderiales bacterium]